MREVNAWMGENMMKDRKVAIVTNNLACNANTKYYTTLEKYFRSNGWEIVTCFDADLVVFSTCGFMDKKHVIIRDALTELKKIDYPEDKIIIMGCQPKTHENEIDDVFNGRIIYFGNENLLDEIISAKIPFSKIDLTNVFKAHSSNDTKNKNDLFYIIIAKGCLMQCSFCVVNKAHGYIKSTPLDEIERQFRIAISLGYRKIYLSGTDTFAYGYDIESNIIELMEYLLTIERNVEFYLGNMHARWLIKYSEGILDLCRRGVINSLHMVLQHVNKDMLKRMGRPDNFSEFYEIICRFKKENPNLFINTDIIVGFHGETEEMLMN